MIEDKLSCCDSLYLLDLSWHLHRSSHAFESMAVDIDGYQRPTGHLYGVFNTIKIIRNVSPNSMIIITQDGHPVKREELMVNSTEGYKEGRPELKFDFYKDIPLVKAACCSIDNVYWAYNDDMECDDLMYALAKKAEKIDSFKGRIYIYSGDSDLLQAIDDRICVIRNKSRVSSGFDEITDEVVRTQEQFTKKFRGVDTKHITNFRVIVGDSSDNIKGIPRFPRDLAVNIAMSTDNIAKGYSYTPKNNTEIKWCDILSENDELIRRNWELMKLTDDFTVKLSKPKVKKDKLLDSLSSMKLNSFINYLKQLGVL